MTEFGLPGRADHAARRGRARRGAEGRRGDARGVRRAAAPPRRIAAKLAADGPARPEERQGLLPLPRRAQDRASTTASTGCSASARTDVGRSPSGRAAAGLRHAQRGRRWPAAKASSAAPATATSARSSASASRRSAAARSATSTTSAPGAFVETLDRSPTATAPASSRRRRWSRWPGGRAVLSGVTA